MRKQDSWLFIKLTVVRRPRIEFIRDREDREKDRD